MGGMEAVGINSGRGHFAGLSRRVLLLSPSSLIYSPVFDVPKRSLQRFIFKNFRGPVPSLPFIFTVCGRKRCRYKLAVFTASSVTLSWLS